MKRNLDDLEAMPHLPRKIAEEVRRDANHIAGEINGLSARLQRLLRILKKEVVE